MAVTPDLESALNAQDGVVKPHRPVPSLVLTKSGPGSDLVQWNTEEDEEVIASDDSSDDRSQSHVDVDMADVGVSEVTPCDGASPAIVSSGPSTDVAEAHGRASSRRHEVVPRAESCAAASPAIVPSDPSTDVAKASDDRMPDYDVQPAAAAAYLYDEDHMPAPSPVREVRFLKGRSGHARIPRNVKRQPKKESLMDHDPTGSCIYIGVDGNAIHEPFSDDSRWIIYQTLGKIDEAWLRFIDASIMTNSAKHMLVKAAGYIDGCKEPGCERNSPYRE